MAHEDISMLELESFSVMRDGQTIVDNINLKIFENKITAIIGPPASGKRTLLRSMNRLIEIDANDKSSGNICYRGANIYGPGVEVNRLRSNVSFLSSKPAPFPTTIFKNLSWAPLVAGFSGDINRRVEMSLKKTGLWYELADRLNDPAGNLTIDQQQRLCLARILAMEADVILMDSPCFALDLGETARFEGLMLKLT